MLLLITNIQLFFWMKEITGKKELIRQLKDSLLELEGFHVQPDGDRVDFGLGAMNRAFPRGCFPTAAVHELISVSESCAAAANGFLVGLLASLLKKGRMCLWVSTERHLFPPALKFFGVEPHQFIFVDVHQTADALWVMEQALRCSSLAAVVAEMNDVSFAESRRLQLAVEESRVTGFLHRQHLQVENTLACVSRWKVRPLPGQLPDDLPGVGFPCLEVELEKMRNGKSGRWQLEWKDGTFCTKPLERSVERTSERSLKISNYA